MSSYDAKLSIEGNGAEKLPVVVDLTDDRITMKVGSQEVADWPREGLRIQALPDGFHIRAEGEAVVLDITEGAKFAVEFGMKTAHPALRQKMAALLRSEPAEGN